jgi:ketosteroid isomerase-like protein
MNRRRRSALARALALLVVVAPLGAREAVDPRVEVGLVVDDWHQAASVADGDRYFGHFTSDGVFLGTDDGERWTLEEFRAYASPYFAKGQGWTYRASARHVMLSPDGQVAWLDEKLDNDHYGRLRGTGVLRLVDGAWKLAHYSMSFPVPNAKTKDVVALIRGAED